MEKSDLGCLIFVFGIAALFFGCMTFFNDKPKKVQWYIVGKEYQAGHYSNFENYPKKMEMGILIVPHVNVVTNHTHHHKTYVPPLFRIHLGRPYACKYFETDSANFAKYKLGTKIFYEK